MDSLICSENNKMNVLITSMKKENDETKVELHTKISLEWNRVSSLTLKTDTNIKQINELIQKILTELSGKLTRDTLLNDIEAAKIAEQKRLVAIAEQKRLAELERLAAKAKEERLERSKKTGRCNVEVTAYGHSFKSSTYKQIGGV